MLRPHPAKHKQNSVVTVPHLMLPVQKTNIGFLVDCSNSLLESSYSMHNIWIFCLQLAAGENSKMTSCSLTNDTIAKLINFSLNSAELPYNDYFEYFGPDFKLHISPSNMTNQNTNDYLEKIKWVHPIPFFPPWVWFMKCQVAESAFTSFLYCDHTN